MNCILEKLCVQVIDDQYILVKLGEIETFCQ